MQRLVQTLMLFLILLFVAAPAFSANITIWDKNGTDPGSGFNGEDNETEPGMVLSQAWDLEGFLFENNNLSMVGGFNFKDGYRSSDSSPLYTSGDIFISTDALGPVYGKVQPGDLPNPQINLQEDVLNTYRYNYVLDLDFSDPSMADPITFDYKVYEIDEGTVLKTAKYDVNEGSSPWQYDNLSGPNQDVNPDVPIASGKFAYSFSTGDTADFTGMDGNEVHYTLTGFDLSFLGAGVDFYSHFTMGCGNDNLMGQGTTSPVPEPATMVLLGSGLVGLALYRRRMKK